MILWIRLSSRPDLWVEAAWGDREKCERQAAKLAFDPDVEYVILPVGESP